MKRARVFILGLAAGLAGLTALGVGGCKQKSGTVVVPDPGPANYATAVRLATEGEKAHKAKDYDKAVELYLKSLDYSREVMLAWHNLGIIYLDRGDRLQAVEMFKNASLLAPDDPRPDYNIGLIYADNGQPDKGMEYFLKSLERSPHYVPALRGAAKVGRFLLVSDKEALERMKLALLLEKDPAWRLVFEKEKLRIDAEQQSQSASGKF